MTVVNDYPRMCHKCYREKPVSDFWLPGESNTKFIRGRSTLCKQCQPTPRRFIDWVCAACGTKVVWAIKPPDVKICSNCMFAARPVPDRRVRNYEFMVADREGYRHWKFKLPRFLRDVLNKIPPEMINRDYTLNQLRWLEYNPRRKARLLAAPTNFTYLKWIEKVNYYGWRCVYCGKSLTIVTLTMDHVKPLFCGGTHFIANLVPACWSCNGKKSIDLRWKINVRPGVGR